MEQRIVVAQPPHMTYYIILPSLNFNISSFQGAVRPVHPDNLTDPTTALPDMSTHENYDVNNRASQEKEISDCQALRGVEMCCHPVCALEISLKINDVRHRRILTSSIGRTTFFVSVGDGGGTRLRWASRRRGRILIPLFRFAGPEMPVLVVICAMRCWI